MLSGKLAALAVFLILMVLLLFGFTAGASLVIANLDGKAVNFPAVTDIARGMGAALLIFGFWALLGFTLATLFRQSAMAIGLGLAYGLVLEGLVFGLLGALGSDVIKTIHTWLPIANASSLSASFGQVPGGGPGPTQSTPLTDANHAVLVLCLYVAWLVGLTSVLVRQRDIV